ncbi:hypothetical protein AN958_08161 [Leucoagaricus sp. SymC.cos]|nr:hypothetical protein AN958_08161 [Leucoagaricus sp. SymC.cos]
MASHRHNRATENDNIFGDSHHHDHQKKPKLPVIPDLRFEYSYLRSIRPYVHVERLGGGDAKEQTSAQHPSTGPKEMVRVEWRKVIWITTRDQVISPLLQGILWAIASYFLTPYSASLGSKLSHLMHVKPPPKEGNAAGWLRNWVKSLGLTSKSVESKW